MNYKGVIIKESLEDKGVLEDVHILETKVEEATEDYKTPWVKQWTLHTVEISEDRIGEIANKISRSLDHEHSWYADFKNKETHYIIFRDKVFKIDCSSKEQYDEANAYGVSLGIPEEQLDYSPEVEYNDAN
jgi:hypothetical protein